MIQTLQLYDLKNCDADFKYAVVRSMEHYIGVTQVTELAPCRALFHHYLALRDSGNWNIETFMNAYVPWYLRDLKNNPRSKDWLNKIYKLNKEGAKVALACFCMQETLCHTSVLAGLYQGLGCEVITRTGNDYSHYYRMYKEI